MRRTKDTLGALLAATALGVLAIPQAIGQDEQMRDPALDVTDFTEKPLQENKVTLPAAPKSENLIPFDAGPARRGFEHFVDQTSLKVGEDGVIRYVLVVKSDMGAKNVTYEGIRCTTRERKIYAYGRPDGSWHEPRGVEWKKIGQPTVEGPIYVLYNDFFCPMRQAVKSTGEAIAALKVGEHPRAGAETFQLTPLGE